MTIRRTYLPGHARDRNLPIAEQPSVTIQADDTATRLTLLHDLERRFGPEARLVLQEFIANAAEHCTDHRVDLFVEPGAIRARDYGGGILCRDTSKPCGEGGYGLTLMEEFGGRLSQWRNGLEVVYRLLRAEEGGERPT